MVLGKRWSWGFIAAALLAVGGWWGYSQWLPPTGPAGLESVDVHPGESSRQAAVALKTAGLIRNTTVFRLYLLWSGKGRSLEAGHYEIRRGSTIPAIAAQLASGKVSVDTVWITIPEGFTVSQIASRLDAEGICHRSAFLLAEQGDAFHESFLSLVPHNREVKYRLEGYLFPDTYEFVKDESAHQVIDEMLRNFERHVDPAVLPQMQKQGVTLPSLITEASLIEREAKVPAERPLIASVIDNRLNHHPPMLLQIDATIEYILGHRDVVTRADLAVKDPYNTYQNLGLPPGPIANPGMPAILAALHPAHTAYLYYVVKNDGSGAHYFATTMTEQLHNEWRSRENLQRQSK